jgi:hypothetical protein
MPARTVNRLITHEFAKQGRYWHRVIRPRHFNRGAFQRYSSYKKRRRSTSRRKQRTKGHQKPLVKSGRTYAETNNHRIQATRNGVTIFYSSAKTLNFKPRGSEINMRQEFEEVSGSEVQTMTRNMSNSISRKLETAARRGGAIRIRS